LISERCKFSQYAWSICIASRTQLAIAGRSAHPCTQTLAPRLPNHTVSTHEVGYLPSHHNDFKNCGSSPTKFTPPHSGKLNRHHQITLRLATLRQSAPGGCISLGNHTTSAHPYTHIRHVLSRRGRFRGLQSSVDCTHLSHWSKHVHSHMTSLHIFSLHVCTAFKQRSWARGSIVCVLVGTNERRWARGYS
jgi:hypothetical protein